MKPAATPIAVQSDLFRPLLRDIINPAHPLVKLAQEIFKAEVRSVVDLRHK